MNATRILRIAGGYVWRLPLCAGAYAVGAAASAAMVTALGLPLPSVPEQADEQTMALRMVLASLALAAGLAPLARRIRGGFVVRWLSLAGLCYVCLGVNTPIEAAIFSNLSGMATIPVFSLLPCLLLGVTMSLLFQPTDKSDSFHAAARQFFAGRPAREWALRLVAAVCIFPLIYWTFGLMIAPFVRPYYEQGQFGLALPSAGMIVLVQFLRSGLFLLAALPLLIAGVGSRRRLILVLGLAFYVLVGLFSMIQTYWLAPTLLVLHNLEIFADSIVYALALTLLLVPGSGVRVDEPLAHLPMCWEQATIE